MSNSSHPLQRGAACLCCRKRKLKCDGNKPICNVCHKMKRGDQCHYDDKKQKSRTQKLREKLMNLEERIKELESEPQNEQSASASMEQGLSRFETPDFNNLEVLPENDGGAYGPPWFEASSSANGSPQPLINTIPSTHSADSASPDHEAFPQLDFTGLNAASMPYMPRWDPNDPLPYENHHILLNIFRLHRQQCCYDGDIRRFDHNSPDFSPPHPALLNAIYLVACHFARSPSFSEYEAIFYSRTLHNITVSLDNSDRLLDIVQASCLIAIYLYANNRALEGYCHAFSAARLAVGLGLHQLKPFDPSGQCNSDVTPITVAPPRNALEHRERIATFWQVFMMDRCWSVANGLPIALPDGECHLVRIKTPWPTPLLDSDTLQPLDESLISKDTNDYIPALRAKAAALFERTFRLTAASVKNEAYWMEYYASQKALQTFMHTLPKFHGVESWRTQPPYLDVDLLAIHTLVHLATIHLQKDHAQHEVKQDAFLCATQVTQLILKLSKADYEFLDPILSACWFSVAQLHIQHTRPDDNMVAMDPFAATVHSGEIACIVSALHLLKKHVPLAGEYCKKIEEECRENHIPLSSLNTMSFGSQVLPLGHYPYTVGA